MEPDPIVASQPFAERAKAFCRLVSSPVPEDVNEFLSEVHRTLATLYGLALALPDIPCSDTDLPPASNACARNELYGRLGDGIGEICYYEDTFDPTRRDAGERVTSDLADDLADIYGDLIDGIAIWNEGERRGRLEAIWSWRFGFWFHWGQHAGGALRCLFHLQSPWFGAADVATRSN